MFGALAIAAVGSSQASVLAWYGALLALLASALLLRPWSNATGATPLGIGVAFLAVWMAGTNQWANPSYSVMAPFHAALLFGGFLFGRAIADANLRLGFRVAVVFALALAIWGLAVQFIEAEARARALFVTPATFAAVINLVLAPAIILGLYGLAHRALLVTVFLLSAAFAGAQSRGAWLALLAALLISVFLARRSGLRFKPTSALRTSLGVVAGFAAWWITAEWVMGVDQSNVFIDQAAPSFRERLSLYALAWNGIEHSFSLVGNGYQAFYYLLEVASARSEYANRSTYFVHNDYLQALFELGLPGLVALAFVALTPIVFAARRTDQPAGEQHALFLLATTAAIATIASHAVVDFPFYIPVCTLLFGALVGIADVLLVRGATMPAWSFATAGSMLVVRRATVAALATVASWALTLPAAAEAAADRAFALWRQGHGQEAAWWFEAARRLNHRDWRYHWYAGQFWLAQAEESRRPDLAQRADNAFASAVTANPREGHALLGRVVTQMRLRDLLPQPADPRTLLAWSDEVVRLSPRSPSALSETERVRQRFAGQR